MRWKNTKKVLLGILLGSIAGIIDVVPMILQKLTWDANISAFSMWVVIGVFVFSHSYKIPVWLGSIVTSFLVLLPSAILIGWKEPLSLIPISVMTLIISFTLGMSVGIIKRKVKLD